MKKWTRDEEGDGLKEGATIGNGSTLSAAHLDELAQTTVKKVLENIKPLLKEVLE